jgi:hypothetical protein
MKHGHPGHGAENVPFRVGRPPFGHQSKMMNIRPVRWLLFGIAFLAVHLAFWLFVIVRDMTSISGGRDVDMGILGAFFILLLFGPLTGAKCAIGYALVDIIVGTHIERTASWHRYVPVVAGLMAGLLLFVGLSLRAVLPLLFDSLVDSYLGGRLPYGPFTQVPWGPMLLGGLSGALVEVVGMLVSWCRRGLAAT